MAKREAEIKLDAEGFGERKERNRRKQMLLEGMDPDEVGSDPLCRLMLIEIYLRCHRGFLSLVSLAVDLSVCGRNGQRRFLSVVVRERYNVQIYKLILPHL